MSRRRLQRLALAWAVTLAEMEIPREERSWQSHRVAVPSPDDGELEKSLERTLGDRHFRALRADDDWHALPPAVRRYRAYCAALVASIFRRAMGVAEGAVVKGKPRLKPN
jgi:hypothetical protein